MFKHKDTGYLVGEIPLYLALQDIDGEDFQCKENQFIIGGGGGEHPAMVINDINMAVIIFLIQFKDDEEAYDYYENYTYYEAFNNLDAFFWTIRNYADFFESAKREGFDEKDNYHVEVWINGKIGDFAYRNFPELINPDILKMALKYIGDK
jgi:hypothetical protein